MTVIKVKNLGKKYLIGHDKKAGGAFRYNSMRDSIAHSMRGIYQRIRHPLSPNRENTELEEFWALKGINFEIKQGDRVGIIGHNGAGKTTLLKLLSRITQPTTGSIKIKGRIASLLEVGTGFHPELSGRENIYLNGAILGMKRAEIKKKFDEIVAFAEIEKFLDTPVKRYSSGMYVRLAFAVAAHLEPEILLVDEVLAVGDAAFQKKSLGKMKSISNEGRTIVFVSHNLQSMASLTERCMLLKDGKMKLMGETSSIIDNYLYDETNRQELNYKSKNKEGKKPFIKQVIIKTSNENNLHVFGKPLEIGIDIYLPQAIRGACLSILAVNSYHEPVLHLWSYDSDRPMCREPGIQRVICEIDKCRLYLGKYTLRVIFAGPPGSGRIDYLEEICPFSIEMFSIKREYPFMPRETVYVEDVKWKTEYLNR